MTSEEALALVEAALRNSRLNQLQRTVFRFAWEDRSYGEIARQSGYELSYVKQAGSQLWQLLSRTFDEKVTKHNVQLVVQRKCETSEAPIAQKAQQTVTLPLTLTEQPATSTAQISPQTSAQAPVQSQPASGLPHCDWGDATDVSHFYGREAELATLEQWILHDRCRLVGIFGMGGIGKTSLSIRLAHHLKGQITEQTIERLVEQAVDSTNSQFSDQFQCEFRSDQFRSDQSLTDSSLFNRPLFHQSLFSQLLSDRIAFNHVPNSENLQSQITQSHVEKSQFHHIIWRSLRNAPPLSDLLSELIQVLSNQQETEQPETIDGQISRLLHYLRSYRCLIVLDNGETVMRQGDHGGSYLPGFEGYDLLWQRLGQSEHQSTVVLTSREKPKGIAAHEGKALPIRSLRLAGLPPDIGQELFNLKGDFTATSTEWQQLVHHYAGNPLALKMVAPVIQDLFDGQIATFLECLQEGTSVFGDIQDLLAQQIGRLSVLEQQIMDWLAVARKPITLSQLRANFTPPIALGQLLEALTSLERRCLIDKTPPTASKSQPCFTLQPVVMEYMTERLIERVCQTLQHAALPTAPEPTKLANPSVLATHALIQAQGKDYIRETQTRLILKPVAERLLASKGLTKWQQQFQQQLNQLRQLPTQQMGYAGGNLINLMCQMGIDLTGWDFSRLTVWNAYLRGVNLHRVNFTEADLAKSVFTETFSQVLAVAFSPDGKLLATGDVNHEVHLWQVADGKPLLSCHVNEGWIWSVAFSPDGRLFASSANRVVHLWDVQTGTCIRTLQGYSDRVFSVAFSADGQLLATGSEDHLVRIWQVRTGQLLYTLTGHTDEVRCVRFSRFSASLSVTPTAASVTALLASASYDGTIRLWDAATGQCLRVLEANYPIGSVDFSPDGQTLASGGADACLTLWDVKTGRQLHYLSGHSQQIRSVAFSRDGRTVASGSDDRTVRLWNYRTGDCLRVLSGHTSWISAVAFNPENDLLASGSEDQSVRLWDSRTNLCLRTLQGYSNGVWSVAFDPQGAILAGGSQDRTIRLWHCRTGELLGSLFGHTSWIWSVTFHPIQPVLASGSEDHTIRIWDIRTHQLLQTLEGHQNAVLAVLYSPDGKTLWSASLDGTIKRWHEQTGECCQTLEGHQGGVWSLDLSLDGQLLISGSQDQTIKIWNATTGTLLNTLVGHQSWIRSVAISPDRRTLISGSADGMIKIWHLEQGICEQTICKQTVLAHQGPVLSIVFHPDGKTIATSSTDTTIKLWDLQTGQCQNLQGHERWVKDLTYSPDGTVLASCSQDETIKFWRRASHDAAEDSFINSADHSTEYSSFATLRIPRPYEGMITTRVTGLTAAQQATLRVLGAIDNSLAD